MFFSKSVLPLGDGRVCHAREVNGTAELLSAVSGGIVIKRVDTAARTVKTSEIISFADGAVFCGEGILESMPDGLIYAG